MPGRPMSSSTDVGRHRVDAVERRDGRRARRARRGRADASSDRRALGDVVVVVDDEHAARRAAARVGARGASAPARLRSRRARSRQAHDELAALAEPVAVRRRRCRRAARPGAARASGRCRGRPARGRACASTCVNSSKMRGSISARDADAVVAHADARPRRRSRVDRRARCAPPAVVYLAALLSRFARTCASARGVAVDAQRLGRQRHARADAALPSISGRARLDRARRRRRRRRPARSASSILPRVMRDTSSRSSTRRDQLLRPGGRCTSRAQSTRSLGAPDVAARASGVADRRERVAQLVREHREELVLAPVGLLDLAVEPGVVERDGRAAGESSASASASASKRVAPVMREREHARSPGRAPRAAARRAMRDIARSGSASAPRRPRRAAGARRSRRVVRDASSMRRAERAARARSPSGAVARAVVRRRCARRSAARATLVARRPSARSRTTSARNGTTRLAELAHRRVDVERAGERRARLGEERRPLRRPSAADARRLLLGQRELLRPPAARPGRAIR